MSLHRHRGLAARYIATDFPVPSSTTQDNGNADKHSASSSPVSDPQTSLLVPANPTSSTSPSTTPSSTTTSSSSIPSTTSTSSSSSKQASSSLASSAAPSVVTVHSTASYANAPSSTVALLTSNLGPATTASASATGTPDSSGSINVTAVVGGIAGTLVGLAAIGFFIMWLMACFALTLTRRRNNQDDEDFNASIFRRQSVVLIDDPPAPSFNPRPPTMIERHVTNASPALAAQRNMPALGYGGYGSFGPGEIVQPAYGQPVMGYGESGQHLARQPSNAAYLTRQPSAVGYGAAPPLEDTDAHYVDLNRSSVTPFQAAQYADISRRLNAMDAPRASDDVPRAPLPSPFDDQPEEVTSSHAAPAPVPQVPTRQHTSDAQRPVSAYTVYEDGDAYGGI
ncbi:hypothetical protein V8B97DRAFT_2036386 [Scleroderma yunnanense]